MGFRDTEAAMSEADKAALWRAPTPYGDVILNDDRTPRRWNDNPLLYVVDPEHPLAEPTREQARVVALVNSYLYVSVFATNRSGPGGMQIYTSAADWALYFHPVEDPQWFALGLRRLYGQLHAGGYQWHRALISQPIECNRCELYERRIDRTLTDGVSTLHGNGRAVLYLSPVRAFMLGTSDHHLWGREEDLPFLWSAVEQVLECAGFESCAAARGVERWAKALRIGPTHSTALVRAVVGSAPTGDDVWAGAFRPRGDGSDSSVTKAQKAGIQFSVLERALDDLHFARSKMLHAGACPPLEWNVVTLAFLGSRFWIALFKKLMSWEGARPWTDDDECEVVGLQALAKRGQQSLPDGYGAYEDAVKRCRDEKLRRRVLEHLERLHGDQKAPPEPER